MASVNVGDVIEKTFVQQQNDNAILTILHYRVTALSGTVAQVDLANSIYNKYWITTAPAPILLFAFSNAQSNEVKYKEVRIQWIKPVRYSAFKFTYNNNESGDVNASPLPANSTAALETYNEVSSRHNRGTKHISGVPLTFVTNSKLNDAGIGAVNDVGDALILQLTAAGATLEPIIYQRANFAASAIIQNFVPFRELRCVRTRTIGVGV